MIDKKYRTQKQKLFEESANRTPHYGIRKFTVGAASVLLSTTLWMGAGAVVHADTVDSATTEQVNTADQSLATERTANTQASTDEAKAETQVPAASAKQAAENGVSQKAASQTENAETVTDTAASNTETQNSASEKQDAALNSAESQASAASVASGQTNATSTENSSDMQKAANSASNVKNGIADLKANNELASATDGQTKQANNTVTLDAKQALKSSAIAKVNKKMAMVSLASATKLADQYEAKGAEYTEIYGQTIDPKSLISNFNELPTGTTAKAANLDAIKTKQGRNVVPVTVTYSDGSTDMANSIVWVTPQGTTALAKSVTLKSNETWDKESVTVDAQQTVPFAFYFSGSAVLDASTVKKGARIYFAQVAEKYNEPMANGQNKKYTVLDEEGNKLGNLVAMNPDSSVGGGSVNLYLDVTEDKQYQNDVTVKFEIPTDQAIYNTDQTWARYREIYLANTDDPYDYSGTIVQKRYLHTAGQSDKEWTINRTVSKISTADPWPVSHSGAGISPEYTSISFPSGMLLGYAGASLNPNVLDQNTIHKANQLAKEIWASKGKVVPSDMPAKQNLHEVWQYTTPTGSYYQNTRLTGVLWGSKQLMTVDGLPSNQASRLQYYNDESNLCYMAPDGTSIQALYDMTPSGRIGFSKQGNDTYLICFNLTADDLRPNEKSIEALVDSNPAMALSKDYEKLKQVNVDFYANNAVASFASWYNDTILLYLSSRNDTNKAGNYYLQDVTPGHAVYATKATLTTGSASAGGKTKSNNTYYFVDDRNNQSIIGGTHQISGGVGDTVPLNLTVPSGYVLASGQSLPTSYTFANTNSDIIINLVPIYKSESLTDTVHRTIDYRTKDGSPAPDSKSDDLKFYGTTITGDLSNLTNRAGQDGLNVTKEAAKNYATKEEALADLDKQAKDIQNKITKYEAEKAAYDAAKKVYDQDLAKWNASQNSEHTVKGISQSLSFANEKDADIDVTSGSSKPVNFIKSSAWLGSDGKGVYSYDNITKSFSDSDISYSRAEGTAQDSSGWGKTYTGVQLKVGDSVVARYTGLKNSVYIDSSGKAHKLSKVQIKYTLNSTTANDNTANLFLSSNPNITLWFGAAGDKKDGNVDLSVDLTFYDESGNPITLGKGSNAWLNMSSLNHKDAIEYFAPGDNTAMEIPGSTIVKHDDGLWYSDVNNEEHGKDWDSPSSPERYYGAAVMELEGGTFHIGKKITGSPAIYDWQALDSSLATAYKPIEPKAPDKPAVSYHEVTATTWDGPKDFADVATPAITGYTADKAVVSDKGISHDADDIHEVVTYMPDPQKATVTFIDDTTKKTLKVENLTGVTNAESGYTTVSQIKIYQGLNYLLVSDDTNGSEIVFDNNDTVNQAYQVHLKHAQTQPVDEKYTHHVTVTRTIKYVMSDGSKAPASVTGRLAFTGQDTIDGVTGEVLETSWTPAQDFVDVASPVLAGYTADRATVSNKGISHDHADIVETVTYNPDAQKATVTYIDGTTGKQLKVDTLNGVSNAHSGYTTKSAIDTYKNLGYALTNDTTNGSEIVFDANDNENQAYTVTLVHTYQMVTNTDNIQVGSNINPGKGSAVWPRGTDKESLEHSVVRSIGYLVNNNKKQGPNPVNDSLDFVAKATVDKVTGEIIKTEWEGAKDFDPIPSPALKGYTPDRKAVVNENINHDHANIYEIVYYNADPQEAIVNYVDATTGRQLKQDDLPGSTLEESGYTTASQIKNYTDNGYELVSDSTGGAEIIFDDDDDATQTYTVTLKHTYITVTSEKPGLPGSPINADKSGVKYPDGTDTKSLTDTVNRTINYVVTGGKKAAPSAVKDSLNYTAQKTIDRVTGEVTQTTWSKNQDFNDVATPALKGYTASKAVVSDKNIAHDAQDIAETVTYNPDVQKATVSYIDDKTGKVLKTENLTGLTLEKSGYTTAYQTSIYQGLGYQLVSDDTTGNEIVFDDEDGIDQAYKVHFTHKLIQPSDSNHVHHVTVHRAINYTTNDGSKAPSNVYDSLSFTGQDTVDAVTGETVSTDWTDAQNFVDITSPVIAGYTADRQVVSNTGIEHDHANIVETVNYTADKQYAHVKYIDDTDKKDLKTDDLEGGSNSIATKNGNVYLASDVIKDFVNQGLKLVSDETGGSVITFDHITGVDQYFNVHLVHDTYTVNTSSDVHRTITYVVHGGNHSAPAPVNDVLHFTGKQTYDKANNKFLSVDWEPNKDFSDVTSPEIKGYTVDTVSVSNRNIAHDAKDIKVTVTYMADTQKAHVRFVDDTDSKTLKTDDLEGESETTAAVNGTAYTTADSIKGYVKQGYKLVSDGTKGATILFDTNTGSDQYYEVHLAHDSYTKSIADDVHRTVTYAVHGGNHSAPSPVTSKLHFTGVETYDKVNNKLIRTDWEVNKDFKDVKSPEIKGYTVDRDNVSNKNIAHDAADINEVVTYTADAQKAHVKYVDDTDSKTLKTDDLEGESDTTAVQNGKPYTTATSIDGYVKQGYKLVSDNTDGATIMLDHATGVDQFYEVHLVHDTYKKAVADDVHRTVHYVVKGGNHAAPEDVEADLHFKGMQTWDKVTNQLLKTDWEPNKDFTDVDTPEIQGYTADGLIVSNRNIGHDHADIYEVVTYTADKQRAHVRYHDDTDNRDLKTVDLEDDSDTLASLDGKPYTTEWQINYYIDRGYAKVSDDTNGMTIMLDHVTGQDQYYNVHLVHTYQTITPKNPGDPNKPINLKGDPTPVWPSDTGAKDLQHDVLRNIHYIVDGGMDKAPDDVNDLLHFEETRVYDKVSGKLISDEWTSKQDFKDITSPSLKGYTVDRETVSNKDIEHSHADIVETVTYNPDAQKAFVTYIDHTTGDTLAIKELDGKTHAKSGYTTKSSIVYYQGLGYQFISDTTDGNEIVYDNDDAVDQYYTVYLEHSYVPALPQNPGKPGEPINQNPDGAKWPDGTDANSLQHDINRTINYVVTGGKDKAPASVHDKLHFEAVAMVDRVTGEIVSTKWDEDKDFSDVKSPELKGYTVDRKVVSNMDIGHDHADIVETVTYNPDAQKATVTYVDKTTGKTLKTDKLDGVTHADSGYNTKAAIAVYTDLGYALVSDTTGGTNVIFDNDDAVDQAFTVSLKHTYVTVTPKDQIKEGTPINSGKGSATYTEGATPEALQHDVKRNVHYVVSNGKKQAPADVNDSLHYEASAVVDKVTGDVVKTTWSGSQDFKDVASPALKGYTVDKKLVSNKNIGHDHADIKEVVTYATDAQKAYVTYIDDTTGKNLDIKVLKGFTLDDSGYNTKSNIKSYQDLGYDLVSDSSTGAEIIFDDEDGVDQAYTVHLAHGKITVTEEKPGKPGEPINPGNGSANYPDGTDKASLGKDVVRTITYKVVGDKDKAPEGTSQTLHFTASKVIDKVTGAVLETTWSGTQDFKDVASPSVKGYTPDQKVISDKGITHEHSNIDEVVTYVPDPQKALVTYYDDTTGKVLKADSLVGVTNKDSGYTTKGSIAGYINLGYKLVGDETGGKSIVFDNDDASDQAYKVHLAHDYITVTPEKPGKPGQPINPDANGPKYPGDTDVKGLTDTVNRTITYVMSDGSKAPSAVKDSLSFTAKKTIDKATGEVVKTEWSANQDFKDVASPALKGYTANTKTVSNKDVAHDAKDISVVVNYTADAQKASVTYIDDATGKSLKVDELNGVTHAKSGYTTKSAIDTYTSLGYTLVSDDSKGSEIVFDNEDSVDQAFTVHLSHGTITVTPENPGKPGEPINPGEGSANYPDGTDVKGLTDTVNRTITYVMSDGSKAPSAVKDTLSYTASKVIDKVTGAVLSTTWSKNQDFKDVESPTIKGYTADSKTVSNKDVAHDAADISVVVKYTADAQKASVTYVDDTIGKNLKVDNLDGVTNAKSGYTTKSAIDTYIGLGYTLVSDDSKGSEIVFDNDDSVDQAFTVHFSHGKITVTPENPGKPGEPINPGEGSANYPDGTDVKGLTDTVNRTITYVMSDGSKAPDAVMDSLSYTASKVIDKVTGAVLSTTWSKNQDFKDVESPTIKGYTADKKTVSNKDVAHDAKNISVVVNYKADAQKASVTYIDDATGKSLKVDELNGVTNAKSGYTTASGIKTYLDLGYKLVGDDTDGKEVVFDNDDKVDQTFTVHLGHDKITVTLEKPGKPGTPITPGEGSANWPKDTDKEGLTSTVTRTITYKMSDGSKAPDQVRQSLYFTGEKVIDKVTGKVLSTTWSKNQDFDDVDSPVIVGYTASLLKASDKNISHDDLDIFVSVVYKADKQKASVTYIDDTTGKAIETKSLTGVSNEHSGYSTISTIKSLENKGYVLVSDDTTGSEIVFDTDDAKDQAYSVHLVHGVTTVTPENPKNPVNGNDMIDRLTKKVHQTIKYVETSGKRLAKSNVQTLTFNRNATVDLVTGAVTSYGDWSGNGETKAVESPKVKDYTADTKTVEAHSHTAEDSDKTFTVTYTADKQAVNLPEGQPGKKEVPSPAAKTAKKVSGKTAAPAEAPAKAAPAEVPAQAAETTATKADNKQAALPQTGESKEKSALLGLGLASILAGIGILGGQKRKKKEN